MVAFSRIRIQGVGWIDPVSLAMLLDVCIYVLCMYGSSLWVYTRPRAGLNSIGLRGVLAFEVCPATSRSNCHSHQVINFFSFIFKYFQTMSSSNFVRGQFSFCKCGPRKSRLGCQQKNLISVKVCKYLQAPSGLDPSWNDATLMTRALFPKKTFWRQGLILCGLFTKVV